MTSLVKQTLQAPVTRAVATAARGARLFHPCGVVYRGVFAVTEPQRFGVPLLDRPGEHSALVRISKAISTPGALPDVLGLAVRIDDADENGNPLDLALATTGERILLRHVFLPAGDFADSLYTSLLPYQIGDQRRMIAATSADPGRRIESDLATLARSQPPNFRLMIATLTGPWRTAGLLTLNETIDEDPWFDIESNAIDGLRPLGWLNRLRGPAYRASQRARAHHARDDHSSRQTSPSAKTW